MEQAMHQFPIIGQIVSASSLGKRSSYAMGRQEESGAKRQRTITLPNVIVNVVCPGSDEEDHDDYEEEEDDDDDDEYEEEYHGGFSIVVVERAWIDLNMTRKPLEL
ncbi:hypothetical protein EYR38_001939 [Pleurotus pulmonarius]|nr:hypothetical protein EYR38_001939 [Pleurotus pulmonarius]